MNRLPGNASGAVTKIRQIIIIHIIIIMFVTKNVVYNGITFGAGIGHFNCDIVSVVPDKVIVPHLVPDQDIVTFSTNPRA